jgi:hypothetical protein
LERCVARAIPRSPLRSLVAGNYVAGQGRCIAHI